MGQRLHEQWKDDCKARRARQEHGVGAAQRTEHANPQPIVGPGPGPRPPTHAPQSSPVAQDLQEPDTNSAAAATNSDAAAVSPTPSSSSVSPTPDVEDLTDDAGDPPPPQDPRTNYLESCRRLLVQAVEDRQGR